MFKIGILITIGGITLTSLGYYLKKKNKISYKDYSVNDIVEYNISINNKNCKDCILCDYCLNSNSCSNSTECKNCQSCNSCISCEDCDSSIKLILSNKCKSCTNCIHCDSCSFCKDCNHCNLCNYLEVCNSCYQCDSIQYCIYCSYCDHIYNCIGLIGSKNIMNYNSTKYINYIKNKITKNETLYLLSLVDEKLCNKLSDKCPPKKYFINNINKDKENSLIFAHRYLLNFIDIINYMEKKYNIPKEYLPDL